MLVILFSGEGKQILLFVQTIHHYAVACDSGYLCFNHDLLYISGLYDTKVTQNVMEKLVTESKRCNLVYDLVVARYSGFLRTCNISICTFH